MSSFKKYVIFFIFSMMISASHSAAVAEDFLIKISFSDVQLSLFDAEGIRLVNFMVALPKSEKEPAGLPVKGRVIKIIERPYWFPTEAIRKDYREKKKVELPKVIKPGDSRNAMGAAKIIIVFDDSRVDPFIRIHGTNQRKSIGKRVSHGCIRMLNEDILFLARIINGKQTIVIFEK